MNSFLYAQRLRTQRSDSQSFTHIISKWAQPLHDVISSRVSCPYLKLIKASFCENTGILSYHLHHCNKFRKMLKCLDFLVFSMYSKIDRLII